jgi:3-isopropylmalate/(R)-2-methylmalate dehydratase small subunit
MEAFATLRAAGIPIDIPNCDTDQIIPARFLRNLPEEGEYAHFLFHDLRYDDSGAERPEFILNHDAFRNGRIVVADVNWGCGSSRENAVDALLANGIRVVVAPSFGDIHFNNCVNRGVVPVRLPREVCDGLRAQLHAHPGCELAVDLDAQTLTEPSGAVHTFEIAAFDRHRLREGLDDVALTLEYSADIERFEERHSTDYDWL